MLGNNDVGLIFKETEVIELAARKFLIHHIVSVQSPAERIRNRIARERPDVVVFGHTHKAFNETVNGILFFNPVIPASQSSARKGALPSCIAMKRNPRGVFSIVILFAVIRG